MASIINVDQIRNAAGTSGLTLNASTGKASFPNGVTIPNGATMPAGSIINFQKYTFSGTQAAGSVAYVDITNASTTYAATVSTSLIRVHLQILVGGKGSIRLLANGNGIFVPDSNYMFYDNISQNDWNSGSVRRIANIIGYYSPASTSAVTYKAQMQSYSSGAASSFGVNELANGSSPACFIEIMEIAQ
jgi:hypothetical protein